MATQDVTAFYRNRRIAEALAALNGAESAQEIAGVLEDYYRHLELDYTLFRTLIDKSPVYDAILENKGNGYTKVEEVQAIFDDAVASQAAAEELARLEIEAVNAVNEATIENVGVALLKYAQVIGLDFTDYNTLTTEQKATVLVAVIEGQPYEDVATIKATFDGAVDAILNPEG